MRAGEGTRTRRARSLSLAFRLRASNCSGEACAAPLCRMVLYSPSFYNFFGWVEAKEFEVASDAFATFKVRRIHIRSCFRM